ncbi:5'-flap endonuclease [Elasticomyces elasticus]|nr:5'-flap endonuclease [Elasticomyces elasticus]KAK3668946.1 5'-flap endonuclease [Elasticomyces elasticus]KAK4914717.1 5'-flap endonuclease [Elasticomyces elasticus]KAK5759212.1 5'-flap endonuclease [Elasticomyces elasticus]
MPSFVENAVLWLRLHLLPNKTKAILENTGRSAQQARFPQPWLSGFDQLQRHGDVWRSGNLATDCSGHSKHLRIISIFSANNNAILHDCNCNTAGADVGIPSRANDAPWPDRDANAKTPYFLSSTSTVYFAILAVSYLRRCVFFAMDAANSPRQPLSELLGNFSYVGPAEQQRHLSGAIATKRRRIELQDPATTSTLAREPRKNVTKPAPEKATKRTKSPTKKPRTVTEAATAAYQPLPAAADTPSTASKFFGPEKPLPEQPVVEKVKKPRKPRTKAAESTTTEPKKAPRPKKVKVTFEKPLPPPLYSPHHALKQAEQQSFLFGTSSQLAAEESPTFIRQMQAALLESELVTSTQAKGISPVKMSCAKVPTAPHGTSLSIGQADSEHWRASSRNWKGGLLNEKSGLKVKKKPTAPSVTKPKPVVPEPIIIHSDPPEEIPAPQTVPKAAKQQRKTPTADPDSFINIDDISDHEPPPTPSPPRRKASASPVPVKPLIFGLPPLASKVSKVSTTIGDALPRARFGEPKILPIPSPEPAQIEQPVKTVLASNGVLKSTDAKWGPIKTELFPQVTAAIRAEPRSTDKENPSWWQKVLLYDPIVLEDLTAFLNAQDIRVTVQRQIPKKATKGRKKKDAEESTENAIPSEITKPTKGRKKKTAEESAEVVVTSETGVQEIREEVQAWMVQKWCEEKSICCLWKEGLRGGVRSNY